MRPMLRLVSVAAVLATLLAVGGGAAATAQEASPAAATPCPATSEDENAALVRRWFEEALNRGNTDVVDELLAPDYLHHQATGPDHVGPAGNKRWLRAFSQSAVIGLPQKDEARVPQDCKIASSFRAVIGGRFGIASSVIRSVDGAATRPSPSGGR